MKTKYKFYYGDWYEAPNFPIVSDGWSSKEFAEEYKKELKSEGWDGFSEITSYVDNSNPIKFDGNKISRVVIIGENGRDFGKRFDKAEFLLQDDGRTIKILTS